MRNSNIPQDRPTFYANRDGKVVFDDENGNQLLADEWDDTSTDTSPEFAITRGQGLSHEV